MSDDRDLHDAFDEYERRADSYGAAQASGAVTPSRSRRVSTVPMMLVAASVALVLVLAGAVVWLADGSDGSGAAAGNNAAGGPHPTRTVARTDTKAPRSSAPAPFSTAPSSVPPTPVRSAPPTARPTGTETLPPTSASPPPPAGGPTVPANAKQMRRALRRVLGDEATFVVTEHYGNYVIGTLTATGAKGGFDIQAVQGNPGDRAQCEDPGKGSRCTVQPVGDGGSLAVERETYQKSTGGGVLYYVNYVFPNGATFLMHLSNRADPKGGGVTYGPKPPLTIKQMVAIIESDRWAQP